MENSQIWPGWECVRRLGSGAFGTVYEINRVENGKVYRSALKVLSIPRNEKDIEAAYSEGMNDEQVRTYFQSIADSIVRECEVMASLEGLTNIVSYADHRLIRHADGIGCDVMIRMQLLTPLLAYQKEHPLTQADVIRLGCDLCEALKMCEKKEILHRDIKPENIFTDEFGNFVLGDFGIARTLERLDAARTRIGTVPYMAPEVFLGRPYDNRVDIYSLGLVLYRYLNGGRLPFWPAAVETVSLEERQEASMRRLRGEQIPLPANCDPALGQAVLNAVAFDPEERYQTAAQFRRALEDCLSGGTNREAPPTVQSRKRGKKPPADEAETLLLSNGTYSAERTSAQQPSAKPVRRRWLIAVLAAVIAAGAVGGGLYYRQSAVQRQQEEAAAEAAEEEAAAQTEKEQTYAALLSAASASLDQEAYADALASAEEAITLWPESVEAYEMKARILYTSGDYEGVVSFVTELVNYPPFETSTETDTQRVANLWAFLGNAYLEQEDYQDAVSALSQAVELYDDSGEILEDYAYALAKTGDLSGAKDCLERARDLDVPSDGLYMLRGEIAYLEQDYTEAAVEFENCMESTEDEKTWRRAAYFAAESYVLEASAKPDEASVWWERALSQYEALYERGFSTRGMLENMAVLAEELDDFERADEILTELAEQYPSYYGGYMRQAYLEADRQQEKENADRDYTAMYEAYLKAEELYEQETTEDPEMVRLQEMIEELKSGGWI